MKIISLLVMFSLVVSGCASMFNGTKETIHVRSNEPDTTFYANNREIGRGNVAIATIRKKELDDTKLRVEKTGCNTKIIPLETQFDATTLLGILIDYGIISILVIDLAINGATTKAAQNDYVLTPDCVSPSQKLIQPGVGLSPAQVPPPQEQKPQEEKPEGYIM
jgi:hypothetical protein